MPAHVVEPDMESLVGLEFRSVHGRPIGLDAEGLQGVAARGARQLVVKQAQVAEELRGHLHAFVRAFLQTQQDQEVFGSVLVDGGGPLAPPSTPPP